MEGFCKTSNWLSRNTICKRQKTESAQAIRHMVTVNAILLLEKIIDDFRLPSPLTLWCLMSFLP